MSQPPQDPYEQQPGWPPQDPYEQQPGWEDPYQQKPGWSVQDPYEQKPGWSAPDPHHQQPGWPPQGQPPYQGQPYEPPPGQQPYPQGRPPYGQQQDPYMQPAQGFYGQQPQPPHGPPGHRARKSSWPRRHRVLTVIGGVFGVFVLIGVIDAAAGGSHHSPGTLAAASSNAPASARPVTYSSVQDVINALSRGGLPCTGGTSGTPVVKGATSETLCNFDSSSQALIDVFPPTHTVSSGEVLTNSVSTGTQQIWTVYGSNWWVQTDTTYDHRVQGILGGKILAGPWHPGANASASSSPAPAAPTMTRQTDTVVFRVSGSGYPSVQYGTDSSSNDVPGGYGPLGNGVALPWSASVTYDPSALYYAVSAQLQGSGGISDSVAEVITTYCSDGTHKTESFPLASGHASGGYAIAQAEYAGGSTGNAAQAESDAGC